jgi:chromatin remodeling complex protein RSC6
VWEASAHAGSHSEAFEIKRQGRGPCQATIKLSLSCGPQRFQLSRELAAIVGARQECRPRILRAIWSYIKANRLQSAANPLIVECDALLLPVLGEKQV